MNDWLATPFTWPEVSGRAVLLVGLGGGSDILTALALRRLLPAGPRRVLIGNTKEGAEDDLIPLTPHIRRLPPGPPSSLNTRARLHGSTWIDRSVPRDEDGPLIFLLRRGVEGDLAREITSLGVEAV